ncbi:siroheme synthase CysG [Oryzibacter oryziterrae]|uniref:siroheme synthase CysG n=1 Tax=Oryzibacter oryziterrae TaxID=2766474 RepID=UPI001F02551D|nr:siroheme synthase CysG [Oryzibacter oryziterrae]
MSSEPRTPRDAAPQRMTPLAKLPLFMDLRGKRVAVAGDTAGIAWKAELLGAAGAEVSIFCRAPDVEILELIKRGVAPGRLELRLEPWTAADLEGAVLALIDSDDEVEIEAFRTAAKAAGALANVVDKPEKCDVQFGSIVNRSPVVVAISTDGTAPVLGQAIRRKIETLLPPAIADWGRLARRIRHEVTERLAPGAARRGFWDAFAERAFGLPPGPGEEQDLIGLIGQSSRPTGKVILVGAGPGDADLLTLKAVRALQSADVILFDDLVSPEVLELGRREARRIMVGKRGGRQSCKQEDINDLMVSLAREGQRVVRLKAGDPMVFGRAGEEIARLKAEDIVVEVVPGISAGIALASALGVSLTHRDASHSLRFVTGHAKSGELDESLDWKGLADPDTTLIVYMGGRTSGEIAARLIAEGLPAETPVVLGYAIGQAEQHVVPLSLSALLDGTAVTPGLPVVIGIGKVFEAAQATSGQEAPARMESV